MLRDMSMAYVFGTEPSIAAFMLAFRFSHLLRRLLGEGALQSAFIPEFESLRHQDKGRAFRFFRDLTGSLTLLLIVLILIGCVGLGIVLTQWNLSEGNREIVSLTALMLPSLLFICLYGLNSSLLQCEKSYFIPSVAPVMFNLMWIIVVFMLSGMTIPQAMPWLALGIVAACFFQWIFTVPKTLSLLKNHLLTGFWKDFRLYSSDLKALSKNLFLGLTGVAATQINNTVDGIFARFADAEGPALLWYAIRIEQLPLALFGIAISGAILPPLSRAIKALNWGDYHKFLQYGLRQTANLILPLTALLLVAGDTYVNLIFGRGDFTSHSVGGTTQCLWAYSLGLLPSALVLILAPACYAQKDFRLPAYASFLTMGINCLLNTWMIVGWGLGAVSVAIATSISAWANLSFLGYILHKRGRLIISTTLIQHCLQMCLIAAFASGCVIIYRLFSFDYVLYDLLTGRDHPSFPQMFTSQLARSIFVTTAFGIPYGLCTLLIYRRRYHLIKNRQIE